MNLGTKENQNQPRSLSQLLVANAFPAAVRYTLHSDDNSVPDAGTPLFEIHLVLEFEALTDI